MQISPATSRMPVMQAQPKPPAPPVAHDSDHDGDVDGAAKAALPKSQGSLVDQFA
jgi:predicted outer membrane protein